MKISKKKITCDYNLSDKDHIDNRHILSFRCPVCHNKTVYDVEKDVYSLSDVGYDDLFVCEECGSEMYGRQKYDGTIKFTLIVEDSVDIKASHDEYIEPASDIQSEIHAAAKDVMRQFGFPDNEVDDYLFVDSEYVDDMLRIEVRAELSYDDMVAMAEDLDPIIQSIDPDCYFDQEEPGIMSAFIPLSSIQSCVTSSSDVCSLKKNDIYSYEDINDDEDVNLDEYEYCGNKDGYQIYRKIVRDESGKPHGEWATQDQDRNHPPFRITYMQALGYDPIDKYDSDVKKLGRELGRMLLPNSSTSVKASKYKRISRYKEFDNGNVLFDYQDIDDDTAEDMARQASLDDPDDVYYVKYDDVMNPDSDYRWYQGNRYNWSDIKYKNGRYQPVTSAQDPEFEEYEDEIKEIDQEFTSENTSINSTKLPAVFKMVSFEPGTVNIDYGGGRFDNVADYLSQYDVINLVYDPYNRTPEHNKEVIKLVREHGGADTATCSNVLNVIKEPEVRLNVLNNIKKLVKSSGEVYITVYEGSGKGNEGATKSGYQLNRKTADYLEEIQQVFPDAKRKGKLIIAHPSGSANSSVNAARKPKYWNTNFRNKVVDAYEKGELSFDNIDEWETEYNDGVKPTPSLGTKEILDYYVSHPEAVTSASYGGAFDIEDDMFFTRDDINEFGYQVAALFSEECGEEFELSDIYMDDPVNLHIQVSKDGIDLSADVKIDMRRIRSPRDLDKYADPVIDQLHRAYQEDYLPYVSGSCVKSASKLDSKVPDDEFIMDGSDEVMAGYQDVDRMRDRWLDPPDYDEPIEVDDEDVEVELLLDADVEIDGEGNWEYLDDSYPWVDERDLEFDSFDYPAVKLDDVTGAVEKVDELLIEKMPFNSGKYHIKGDVILVYNISGVEYDESYEGPDEDGQPSVSKEYYMDNTDVTWLRNKSIINNFEFDRIR